MPSDTHHMATPSACRCRSSAAIDRQRSSDVEGQHPQPVPRWNRSSREISSLPSTSDTSSRRFQRTVCGQSPPDVVADRRRHHHHGVGPLSTISDEPGRLSGSARVRADRSGRCLRTVVDRFDRDRVHLTFGARLQRLYHLFIMAPPQPRTGLLSSPTVPSCSVCQAVVDIALVHVDQNGGPFGRGLRALGADRPQLVSGGLVVRTR